MYTDNLDITKPLDATIERDDFDPIYHAYKLSLDEKR
jgi:hypothetical protein